MFMLILNFWIKVVKYIVEDYLKGGGRDGKEEDGYQGTDCEKLQELFGAHSPV